VNDFSPLTADERAVEIGSFVSDGVAPARTPIKPPSGTALPKNRHPVTGLPPDSLWPYRRDGEPLFYVARYNLPDGGKDYRPISWFNDDKGKGWGFGAWPAGQRPLYNLDKITAAPAATIILCEGEKAACAAALIFPDHIATTTSGGSKAPNKTNLAPLAGRTVIICPDDDEPGRAYAETIVESLSAIGCNLSIVDTAALRQAVAPDSKADDGWDIADAKGISGLREAILSLTTPVDRADVLVGIVEKTATDAGAPFEPAVLAALKELKKRSRPEFETLRARLKKAGCRVTELDGAIAGEDGEGSRGQNQTDALLGIVLESAELFHTEDGSTFADIEIAGHRETWNTKSKGFRRWLARAFMEETGGAPNSDAIGAAMLAIESKAQFDGPEREVFVRVGGANGKIYLDLVDDAWRAVEIDATGWRIVDEPPARFRRSSGMKPLPVPTRGGNVIKLRPFLNVATDEDFVLAVSWLLACLRPTGPYPILALGGEQGTAKSTFAAILRALVDPNSAPLRSLTKDVRDLFIASQNSLVLAFDNVSGLPDWISDAMCRLSTGGGFSTRQLHTDNEEQLFNGRRPQILNGIEDCINRPDLADRAILMTLDPISEADRRRETELWAAFEAERPAILGALLDAVSKGLEMLPSVKLEKLPRMADFAEWSVACEPALWEEGSFLAAYTENRGDANESLIAADPVANAVSDLMATMPDWGPDTATELLRALTVLAPEKVTKSRAWPADATRLSGKLRRAAPALREAGIYMKDGPRQGVNRAKTIILSTMPFADAEAAPAPAPAEKKWGGKL
jgi:hypothetical protein